LRIITINYNPHKMSKNDNNVVEGQLAVVVDGNADNPFNIKAEGRLIVAKWFLVPEGTDVGVVSLNSLAKVNINFSIFSPDKHIIKQISNGVRVEESPSGQLKEGGFLEIYRFTGHLNQTQIGPFESKISLFDESGNSRDFKISGVICK